jgi:hypothetical protein
MKTMAWYRVPEAWLLIILLAGGVFAGVGLAVVAWQLPDAHITNVDAHGQSPVAR